MKLLEYLKLNSVSQSEMARNLGVPSVLVNQWSHGVRQVPAERCPAIERITHGAVRCEDLRPDIDWADRVYLPKKSRKAA